MGKMKKVLIIEDNNDNREVIRTVLMHYGYEVVEAVNGEEGLEKARQEKLDIILMDLSLPKMDGWEATRRLKADDELKDIPVIAITAHAMSGDEEKAMKHGCDGYLAKPCTPKSVIDIVEKFVKENE